MAHNINAEALVARMIETARQLHADAGIDWKMANGEESLMSLFTQGVKARVNVQRNHRRNREFAKLYKAEHDVD